MAANITVTDLAAQLNRVARDLLNGSLDIETVEISNLTRRVNGWDRSELTVSLALNGVIPK